MKDISNYAQYGKPVPAPSDISKSDIDRRRADYKCEVHYIGEIVCGSLFPPDEEIFCEASLEMSSEWTLLSQFSNKYAIQTQCCAGPVPILLTIARIERGRDARLGTPVRPALGNKQSFRLATSHDPCVAS